MLDVGCGPGRLLEAFRTRGWEVQGSELGEGAARAARARGIPVHVGPLEAAGIADGSLDAVTMWHVLEHWPDPAVALAHAARLLRPGGVLMVGVPNFGSPEARATCDGWFHLDVPRHLAHLDPAALARLLGAAGLRPVRWSFLAPEFDVFSFVQSAENALGLPRNLLYSRLRSAGARLGTAGALATAAAFLLAAPLGVLAVPATAVLSALGRGSSVTAFAVKG
ncbi:MAG: class I SAM-dependent methyltransferase [Anaeromyxobacter sp.]